MPHSVMWAQGIFVAQQKTTCYLLPYRVVSYLYPREENDMELVDSIEARRRYFEGIGDEDLFVGFAAALDAGDIAQAADIGAELSARKET